MADFANANNLAQKRVIKSQPNMREERLKQQKAWKKKRRERESARTAVTTSQQDGNADKSSDSSNDLSDHKTKPSSSCLPKQTSNLRREGSKQPPRQPTKAFSRGL